LCPQACSDLCPFFQHVEVKGLKLKLDHRPSASPDLRKLQAGHYSELLKLLPLRGVTLLLPPLCVRGLSG
jgi:hypothetical protein